MKWFDIRSRSRASCPETETLLSAASNPVPSGEQKAQPSLPPCLLGQETGRFTGSL